MTSGYRTPRVLVIGAGLLGVSVAGHAAMLGADVILLDANSAPNFGASKWSYAWFNSNNKNPDWYHALNVRGMEYYPVLARELGDQTWYHQVGHLMWRTDGISLWPGESELSDEDRFRRYSRLGYPVERLTQDEVCRIEPAVDPASIPDESHYFPSEGWIDTVGLTNSMLRWGKTVGLLDCRWATPVKRFVLGSNRVRAVVTGAGETIAADVFINCAGANAATVAESAGTEIQMESRAALVGITKKTTSTLRRVIHAGDISMRPHPGSRLLLHRNGSDDRVVAGTVGYEVPVSEIRLLQEEAAACLRANDLELERVAMVDMPIPADGYPAVGRLLPWDNFYAAVTHSGATIGSLLGRLLAEHIVAGTWDDALDSCVPARLKNEPSTVGDKNQASSA